MTESISLVTLVNNDDTYRDNVLESTREQTEKIEYIKIYNSPYASHGLNNGLKRATNEIVICCHQDIYFLNGWYEKLFKCFKLLDLYKKKWGVCGIAGTKEGQESYKGMVGTVSGLVMDECDVKEVQTLDCCVLITRKSINKEYKLKFDRNLKYFHMYGEDFSLQCHEKGLNVCCLNVPMKHNTLQTAGRGFSDSLDYIKKKWRYKVPVLYTTVGTYMTGKNPKGLMKRS